MHIIRYANHAKLTLKWGTGSDGPEVPAPIRVQNLQVSAFAWMIDSGSITDMATVSLSPMNELLRPLGQNLTPDYARTLIGLKADAAIQKRVATLAAKANEGTLTAAEKEEYHSCILAGSMIAYLEAQARLLLARLEP